MNLHRRRLHPLLSLCLLLGLSIAAANEVASGAEPDTLPKATIDGTGPGWRKLAAKDFARVNGADDTWTWNGELLHCTGMPVGVMRTAKQYKNFELVLQWRHLQSGGNSGVFVWASEAALTDLPPGKLPPGGIEVQILDHGYKDKAKKSRPDRPTDWFTTNGDVFAVGKSTMDPFPPLSPNGSRSFPRKELSRGSDAWNHYYVRGVNGEVRLWVNGEEVSGGANCQPDHGFLCLESEGAPVEFKEIRIRELP